MTRLRVGTSYWLDHEPTRPLRLPSLTGRLDADVVIVGGGITGCSTAHCLARSGARVVLIEAGRIGRGSTAASTALLMQEPDVNLGDLSRRYGPAVAAEMWRQSRRGVRQLVSTLTRSRADVGLRMVPSIYLSREQEDVPELRRELLLRQRAGIAARWLDPEALRRRTGIDGSGALLTAGNAQCDPYRACLALARAARTEGGRLFAGSRARRIRASNGGVLVELDRGAVTASHVIVATGYATPEFKPLLGRFRLSTTYVIATAPLSAGARRATGLGDVMWWDTQRPYHYSRWTADGRLLFGGEDRAHRGRARRDELRRRAAALATELGRLYPQLAPVEPAYAWEGLFATTPDGLPYIGAHRRYPHHLFALGYGGNGMTFGFAAAEILNRLVHGRPRPSDALFAFSRARRLRRR